MHSPFGSRPFAPGAVVAYGEDLATPFGKGFLEMSDVQNHCLDWMTLPRLPLQVTSGNGSLRVGAIRQIDIIG